MNGEPQDNRRGTTAQSSSGRPPRIYNRGPYNAHLNNPDAARAAVRPRQNINSDSTLLRQYNTSARPPQTPQGRPAAQNQQRRPVQNIQPGQQDAGTRRPPVPQRTSANQQAQRPPYPPRTSDVRGQSSAQRGYNNPKASPKSESVRDFVDRLSDRQLIAIAAAVIIVIAVIICLIIAGTSRRKASLPEITEAPVIALENALTETTAAETVASPYAKTTDTTVQLGENISSKFGILVDVEKNTVVAEKNPDERIYPASMTKMMTLIVAAEHITNLDDTFEMTAEIIDPLYRQNATISGILAGEKVTVRDLLYGVVLPSGADCTVAIAQYVSGNETDFVALMNEKAAELGLAGTHFANSSGLHNTDHYSTVHDMALILKYALTNEFCRTVLSTAEYTTTKTDKHPDGLLLQSTLFTRMYGTEPEVAIVKGGKTGYTTEAGNCLASYAVSADGREFIFVTASADASYKPVNDCIYAYSKYTG